MPLKKNLLNNYFNYLWEIVKILAILMILLIFAGNIQE
jgi:hypothetical protein